MEFENGSDGIFSIFKGKTKLSTKTPRTSNMRHLTGPDGQKIGSYGKYQKLSLTTPVQKSFREQRK
jgi:hypothetical protein